MRGREWCVNPKKSKEEGAPLMEKGKPSSCPSKRKKKNNKGEKGSGRAKEKKTTSRGRAHSMIENIERGKKRKNRIPLSGKKKKGEISSIRLAWEKKKVHRAGEREELLFKKKKREFCRDKGGLKGGPFFGEEEGGT